MNQEEAQLHAAIADAFADRSMPTGRLIEDDVDLGYHLEAQRVDAYFRKHKAIVDPESKVIVAFIYMNVQASLWLLPLYMNFILTNYKRNSFLIDIFFQALAGRGSPYRNSPGDTDLSVRRLATDREAAVVCRFCRWLKHKDDMLGYVGDDSDDAIKLWCTRP